jgi:hypothetical protein
LRRAIRGGLPVVIVSAPLDLPPGNKLGYIVNGDEKMDQVAAAPIARLLRGSIAVVGLVRYAPRIIEEIVARDSVPNRPEPIWDQHVQAQTDCLVRARSISCCEGTPSIERQCRTDI